jgi:molybdenum cofactor guanylyltransferase
VATGIILAGGKSRRLGQDKASTVLAGKPLIVHVLERLNASVDSIVVVTRPGQELPAEAAQRFRPAVFQDLYPGAGPLGGLLTGLSAAGSFPAIAVACDMPFLEPALLHALLDHLPGYDAVVPVLDGMTQPLCAAYAGTCIDSLKARLEANQLRLIDWLNDINVRRVLDQEWKVADPDGLSFFNLNTPDDLAKAEAVLAAIKRESAAD